MTLKTRLAVFDVRILFFYLNFTIYIINSLHLFLEIIVKMIILIILFTKTIKV